MNQKEYIGKKIREYRKSVPGLSASKLGNMLKTPVSDKTIYSWERGRTQPDGDQLIELCVIFGVQISDFYFKPEIYLEEIDESNPDSDFIEIGVVSDIAAGVPIELTECDYTFPCPRVIAEKHPNSRWYKVVGDSWNRKIPNGCLALVDFDRKEPLNDRVPFAVCVNGYSATIKGVQKLGNGYRLIPNSWDETITPLTFDYNKDDTEEVTIMGEVVYATFPYDYEV